MDLLVGFDLDMTLVDSRAGIARTMTQVMVERGVTLTDAQIWPMIGPPLEQTMAPYLPAEQLPGAVDAYRDAYPSLGIPLTTLLPGASASIAAVRAAGGRVAVVSAKIESAVVTVLEAVGITADVVVGDRFAEGKAEALRAMGAQVYVGDHPGDVLAALGSGAAAVTVATGPTSSADLLAAGAEVVLDSLEEFPAWLDTHLLERRLAELDARLHEAAGPDRPVVVAFSGGADSAFVLAAAVRALGADRVIAATAVSPSLATGELEAAASYAAGLGVRHLTPATHELEREGYVANAGDRCYYCKSELVDVLTALDDVTDGAVVLTGTNADDARAGFRPGIRAADERGAVAPLRDAGLTKAQVREASRRWGLATADKPAAACLSSRIAYGVPVTAEALARVDRAEVAVRTALLAHGALPGDLRVRDLGERGASIELGTATRTAALGDDGTLSPLGDRLVEAVRSVGFEQVALDPRGFRSGSMNELLPQPELFR